MPLEELTKYLGKLGLVPGHFQTLLSRLNEGAEAATQAIKEDILCLGWITEAVKPAEKQ